MKNFNFALLLITLTAITSYAQETRKFSETGFSKLSMGSAFNVNVEQGSTYSILVTGQVEDINDLKAIVKGDELHLGYKNNSWGKNRKSVKVVIVMPDLDGVDFSGACKAAISNFTNVKKMDIEVSGASQVEMRFSTSKVNFELSGASSLTLNGSCSILNGEVSGASSFKGKEFTSKEVNINASGASRAIVYASKSLSVEASGASSVRYLGGTKDIKSSTSGASTVKRD